MCQGTPVEVTWETNSGGQGSKCLNSLEHLPSQPSEVVWDIFMGLDRSIPWQLHLLLPGWPCITSLGCPSPETLQGKARWGFPGGKYMV